MRLVSGLFCLLLLSFHLNAQTTYYVDGVSGLDTHTGLSLVQAWKTVQKACASATPNSQVLIKGGTYHENLVMQVSGTAGNPILFRNYQQDSVYIDGTGLGGTTLMQITDKNYITLESLVFQNLTGNNAQGVLVESSVSGTSTGIELRKLIVRHINWTASPTTIPNQNDNSQALIVYGRDKGLTNLLIDSCQVYANILGFSEAVSIDGNIMGFTVSNCLVHDNTNIGILAAGNYGTSTNAATDHARNGLITKNTCYRDVSLYATSAGIYVDGGRSVVIDQNTSWGNGSGIELGCEQNGTTDSITVKNNLLYNNQYTGLAIGGYTTATTGQVLHCEVRNNTFFSNNDASNTSGEIDMTKASYCRIENNVFYTCNNNTLLSVEPISPQLSNVIDYNVWFTPANDSTNLTVNWGNNGYSTFGTYQSATGMDAHSFYQNPLLSNAVLPAPNLHLTATSPCINKGNPATVLVGGETDFDGDARSIGGRVDMGAYEYNPVTGIWDLPVCSMLKLFPNPASEVLFYKTSFPGNRVELWTGAGQLLAEFSPSDNQISLSGFSAGIYVLRFIKEDGESFIEHFIKK